MWNGQPLSVNVYSPPLWSRDVSIPGKTGLGAGVTSFQTGFALQKDYTKDSSLTIVCMALHCYDCFSPCAFFLLLFKRNVEKIFGRWGSVTVHMHLHS